MSVLHLLHNLARSYRKPGGIKLLAEDMGRADEYNTIKNKLNPNTTTHHTYAEEIDDYVAALDTDEVAKYFCRQRGGIFVKSPVFDDLTDDALFALFLERSAKMGTFDERVKAALHDRRISNQEYNELMTLYDEVTAVREGIKLRLTEIHERTR